MHTIKISRGKHIRDASVLACDFVVATYAHEQCVGQRFESARWRDDYGKWQKPLLGVETRREGTDCNTL